MCWTLTHYDEAWMCQCIFANISLLTGWKRFVEQNCSYIYRLFRNRSDQTWRQRLSCRVIIRFYFDFTETWEVSLNLWSFRSSDSLKKHLIHCEISTWRNITLQSFRFQIHNNSVSFKGDMFNLYQRLIVLSLTL